jgi:alcohol dehydrogenase (cytochrome c)
VRPGQGKRAAPALALISVVSAATAAAQGLFADDPAAKFTAEEASRGQAAYVLACQSCHGATLEGTQFGVALKGAAFVGKWRGQSAAALATKIRTTMPPGKLGSLSAAEYSAIQAYVLQANAAVPAAAAADQGAGMMGAMKRPDHDPLLQAALKAHQDKLAAITPVTQAVLEHPADADWVMARRSYDALGFSPLARINRSNVAGLRAAWSWVLPQSSNEITPLVHDGVIFVYSGAAVQALDGATGDLLWQYLRPAAAGPGFGGSHGKSLAIYDDKLFAATSDGHMIALELRTGHLVWDQEVIPSGPAGGGLGLNSAPMVAKGVVIAGVSLGVANPGGCFIVGLDARTGKELWRFHTVARPGQPGGDSWNGAPVEERFGGGVWTVGSYDPALDLVYFGVGNTYDTATLLQPRPGAAGLGPNDALYTDSTVVLRPETGELVWYFQHQKRDVWDLDWVFEQSLVTLPVKGRPRKLVVTGGKTALFDALDAATGQFVFAADLGLQNVVTAVDPVSGAKTINPAVEPQAGVARLMCPNSIGARNWMATALNPQTDILYVPLLENCADYTYAPRDAAQTAKGGLDMHFSSRPPEHSDGNFGRIAALDLKTRQILWTHRQRIPLASAALATGGGLLFAGDADRYFTAYDQATGKVLWRNRLNAAAESFPVTFAANGRQYVAVVVGSGSPMGAASRAFVPEVSAPTAGVTLVVFELP